MRISLDRADAQALRVDLPGTRHESIAVRSAKGLRGIIERSDASLKLEAVAADSVELEAVHVALGSLFLSSASGATLTQLGLALEQTKTSLALAVKTGAVEAQDLEIAVDNVLVRGRVKLTKPELVVRGDEGGIASEHVEIADFVLRIGDLELTASMVRGDAVKIGWGAAGFRLTATALSSPVLRMNTADVQVTAGGVAVTAFSLAGPLLAMASLAIQSGQAVIGFRPSSSAAAPAGKGAAEAAPTEPLFDWRALDTLSGQLDVDVAVDLTVPIIGRRKATHRLRIAIDQGTLDYRALESNLSKLEDALLDFSVRDGALVLERVNPLFPARGHGKPIIIWDVDAVDHELARRDRVRLSVLPQARLASDARDEGEDANQAPSKSSISLRELGLLHINARLALTPPSGELRGQVRPLGIGSFILGGSVFHETGGSREGSALGEIADLSAAIHQLVLGRSRLDVANVKAAAISPIEIAFADVSPTKLQLGLSGVVLEDLALTL